MVKTATRRLVVGLGCTYSGNLIASRVVQDRADPVQPGSIPIQVVGRRLAVPRDYVDVAVETGTVLFMRYPTFAAFPRRERQALSHAPDWNGLLITNINVRQSQLSLDVLYKRLSHILELPTAAGARELLFWEREEPNKHSAFPVEIGIMRTDYGQIVVLVFVDVRAAIASHYMTTSVGTIQVNYSSILVPEWASIQAGIQRLINQWEG